MSVNKRTYDERLPEVCGLPLDRTISPWMGHRIKMCSSVCVEGTAYSQVSWLAAQIMFIDAAVGKPVKKAGGRSCGPIRKFLKLVCLSFFILKGRRVWMSRSAACKDATIIGVTRCQRRRRRGNVAQTGKYGMAGYAAVRPDW